MDTTKVINWNPFTSSYLEDPYPHLSECRESNPVQKTLLGTYLFLGYHDVHEIIKSEKFETLQISSVFEEREDYIFGGTSACPYLAKDTKKWPMHLNGSEHREVRSMIGKAIASIDLIPIMEEALKEQSYFFSDCASLNLAHYSSYFQFQLVKQIFGITEIGTYEKIKQFSSMLTKIQDSTTPKQIHLEINEWLAWGRKIFSDSKFKQDIISFADSKVIQLTDDDMHSLLLVSMAASFETTKDTLAFALLTILRSEDWSKWLTEAKNEDVRQFNEEIFRLFSPAQYTLRVCKEPATLGGLDMPAGARIALCIASANRDPEVFDRPDEILLNRATPHIGFGKGLHFCLGSQIARQELNFVLKPMINFLKERHLTRVGEVKMARQIFMRSFDEIPITRA